MILLILVCIVVLFTVVMTFYIDENNQSYDNIYSSFDDNMMNIEKEE